MSPGINALIWAAGVAVEGTVFYLVMRSVRRLMKQQQSAPVQATAYVARPELTPQRRELTR